MKKTTSIITILLLLLATYWGFKSSMPIYKVDKDLSEYSFSTDKALAHVKKIGEKPHAVGFPAHAEVRAYIIDQLEKIGLETSTQKGYTAGDWANLSQATNIIARIKGSGNGKSLILLSHYDSNPHSSLGASDAGSGVATILEGIRAYLAKNKTPKNDIIILISDAEELGLNGADLFVNKHPWARNAGMVLNFEARGSGGPSYMLIETNTGNGNIIKEFTKANPDFPVANSLVYSIYKMLPNDTDLTVFREKGNIDGMNFAFIDDHYDYHTEKDTYERLDKKTLAHQGSYLMPLLLHFSNADLSKIKSDSDYNYFNVPYFKLVSYPFSWAWYIFGIAVLGFIIFLIYGLNKKIITPITALKSFVPALLVILINTLIGYFSWSLLKLLYPAYQDILHGFTYNGYTYIAAFTLSSIGVCFYVYHRFNKITTPNLLIGPITIWLLICGGLSMYLPGANFFTIPVIAVLASFLITINQQKPNSFLLVFLALPAIWIFTPFIKMFPVGLGLKMMVASTMLSSLLFLLLLPIFAFYKHKGQLALVCLLLFLGCMVSAHFNSGFTEKNAKPTSLLYVYDKDTNTAKWATYENVVSNWTSQFINDNKTKAIAHNQKIISSKYGTGFTYISEAPLKDLNFSTIKKTKDTIIGTERHLQICITPERYINRLEIFTNDVQIKKARVNTIALSDKFLSDRRKGKLITHYITDNAYTELELVLKATEKLELTFYEASNDLLTNKLFTIPKRPKNNIPMPFVLNDAILVTKTISFE
ncbi:M28 family peptidase [Cellulophaga sp. HaHaR_3_176]|uniref:M28 family peptidase n=1 Tax=Cellulophaga sp. HaHaR_3_176 TaxID=1942464 RepID=UPI001C1F8BBE|nr:M28 family peptidase [Cellulophaga sp. HaHaR_3_176]QWX83890.1 M28 family peptidase [Cellulophaga sp. HaHaR_3_176]